MGLDLRDEFVRRVVIGLRVADENVAPRHGLAPQRFASNMGKVLALALGIALQHKPARQPLKMVCCVVADTR
jgi:hypothetical protein